eukprot:CAMPEP_0178896352 /NCGR_PEP_ID=MMETSP0786-20121207/1116_1 /TAXON_ID=186022 /ORGANISM="Thalassionema frauenfeldii, Strain CCMP 1798" /LENGTH=155 /DNA_ID=CAMNT_0020566727 /DNA_START=1342 /DNA_END=1806 /DNA_ORIENTATION=-
MSGGPILSPKSLELTSSPNIILSFPVDGSAANADIWDNLVRLRQRRLLDLVFLDPFLCLVFLQDVFDLARFFLAVPEELELELALEDDEDELDSYKDSSKELGSDDRLVSDESLSELSLNEESCLLFCPRMSLRLLVFLALRFFFSPILSSFLAW